MVQHLSDSKVQSVIEREMLSYIECQHKDWQKVDWREITVGREFAGKVKPDEAWRDSDGILVIAECYARIGKLKPGHRRKIATDLLKLIFIKDEFGESNSPRLLLVVPEELGSQLEGTDWLSLIITKKIELIKIPLNDEQCKKLNEAVSRQGAGQARNRSEKVTL